MLLSAFAATATADGGTQRWQTPPCGMAYVLQAEGLSPDRVLAIDRNRHRTERQRERSEDDVVDHDLVLVWTEQRRVITGADLLGRLLRGIAKPVAVP